METTIKKLLVIPDSHASAKYDNERFHWLGRYILGERPDVIVNLGDMADMPSLSSYDKGKASAENKRYVEDIAACNEALAILQSYEDKAVVADKKAKRKPYAPDKYVTLGNHEGRIPRYANDNPPLVGTLSVSSLEFESNGWAVCPYRQEINLGGVTFSHDYATGISGRPIGGESIAKTLIHKNLMSSVQGHSHVFDHAERTRIDGTKVFGLSAGCYVHPDMIEDWNIQTHHLWWRGIVVLHNVAEGYYDRIEAITMRDIEAKFGSV